jgi:TonB family protein
MKRFASALARSTLFHLLIAVAVVAWVSVRGGKFHQKLRLGATHATGVVELRWSGSTGAPSTPRNLSVQKTGPQPPLPYAENQGAANAHSTDESAIASRPAGSLVVPNGAPEYPALSRRAGEQGTVTLEFYLRKGRAQDISVLSSSGHSRLDQSALSFLQSTHLDAPAELAGDRKLQVSFVFKLQN